MYKRIRIWTCSIWLSACAVGALRAQTTPTVFSTARYAPVVTAVPFLGLSTDARAGALGDAGIGSVADANSTFWNIAKTANLEDKFTAAVNYNPLFSALQLPDLFLLSFTGTYKIKERQSVSLFGKYMNVGRIDLTDVNGEPLQTVRPNEFSLGVGYALRFASSWSLGVSAKYVRSNLLPGVSSLRESDGIHAGQAFAMDLGINYRKEVTKEIALQWGLALSNLGNKVSYGSNVFAANNAIVTGSNFLPANIGTGFGYQQQFSEDHKLNIAFDINKLLVPARPRSTNDVAMINTYNAQNVIGSWIKSFYDAPGGFAEEMREFMFSGGAEYIYHDFLSLRTGIFWQDQNKGARSFYSAGVGLTYKEIIQFNLVYFVPLMFTTGQNTSPLTNTLRIGLIYNFREQAPEPSVSENKK